MASLRESQKETLFQMLYKSETEGKALFVSKLSQTDKSYSIYTASAVRTAFHFAFVATFIAIITFSRKQ